MITLQMQIENLVTGGSWVSVSFYASPDPTINSSDFYLGQWRRWLNQRTGAAVTLSVPFPTNIPPGTYYIGWIIDPNNEVWEADETNNIAHKSTPRLTVVSPSPSVLYVDAAAHGTNDGSSWTNALISLQDALAMASIRPTDSESGREIRVARGTYIPDQGVGITRGDREASFTLAGPVTILGGYAGAGAPDPSVRDVQIYATILSGDLAGNDPPVTAPANLWKEPSRTDNSRHVLRLSNKGQATAILDGVQVVGGYAFGPSAGTPSAGDTQGAGLLLSGGSLTVRNCTFAGNWAAGDGGAIHVADGHLELTDCTFRVNGAGQLTGTSAPLAGQGTGGALRSDDQSQLTLSRCRFYSNFAGIQGGALDHDEGNAVLTHCLFVQNTAGNSGGGAIWNSGAGLNLVNCIFNGNHAEQSGGALVNGWGGILSAANCLLHANSATVKAGAIDNFGAKATLWNCTLAGNLQDGTLGAIVCEPTPDQTNAELTLANCILWDLGGEISKVGNSVVTVGGCDVQGGWPGTGNLAVDPRFVQPTGPDGILGTEDDNLRLRSDSPCIDRGNTALLPQDFSDLDEDGNVQELLPLDLDGKARTSGNAVDLGAYEVPSDSSPTAASTTSSSCSGG